MAFSIDDHHYHTNPTHVNEPPAIGRHAVKHAASISGRRRA